MSLLFSDAFGDALLDSLFGGAALPAVTDQELSLWNGNPFAGGAELSGSGYIRFTPWPPATSNEWPAVAGANGGYARAYMQVADFPNGGVATADWVQATHLALSIATAAAPVLALTLPAATIVANGDQLAFPAYSLKLEMATEETPATIDQTWALDLLDILLNGGAHALSGANWYLSLWIGNPFAGGTEVSTTGTSYARLTVANSGASFNPATVDGRRAVSVVPGLRWPATGLSAGAFGAVTHIGFSTGAGTSPKFARPLPGAGRTVGADSFLQIPAAGLILSLFSAE